MKINTVQHHFKITAATLLTLSVIMFINTRVIAKVTTNDSAREKYWTQRVDRFAKQREQHHYSQISWNTRDLGGYVAANGYHIKNDAIFRSNALNDLNQQGSDMLANLKINQVIDLRSATEKDGINALPDPNENGNASPLATNVQYFNYPTNTAAEKAGYKAQKQAEGQIFTYGHPFTTYQSARTSYLNIFKQLLNNQNGAVLFHCLNGHDRTGLAAVVVLSALGVAKKTIYNDYLLTNYYHHKNTYVEQVAQVDRFYQTVAKNYGNMQNYLRNGIGLTAKQQQQLKTMYLIK